MKHDSNNSTISFSVSVIFKYNRVNLILLSMFVLMFNMFILIILKMKKRI